MKAPPTAKTVRTYTEEFCKELCRGLVEQKKADANEVVMIGSLSWEEHLAEANLSGPLSTQGSGSQMLNEDEKKKQEVKKINDLTLDQLLGRTPGMKYDGNHEDTGVPRCIEGGSSEMEIGRAHV